MARKREKSTYNYFGGVVMEDNTYRMNFHTDLTFSCNMGCDDCMKMLGVLPWKGCSHLTEEDVKVSGILFRRYRISLRRLRISGGEPLLHPKFEEICSVIEREWNPLVIRVYINGTLPPPWKKRRKGITFRPVPKESKIAGHVPFLISPVDIGITPIRGFSDSCSMMSACGRSFDTCGFVPCMQSVHIGRILGVDAHKPYPVLHGDFDICKHCICSVSKREMKRCWTKVNNGEIEYPTRTYREGIEREKQAPVKYVRFLDRLSEFEDVDKLVRT